MSNRSINLKTIGIDIGHNVNFDGGAVGIRKEDELNKLVGEVLIEKFRAIGIKVINCTPKSANSIYDSLNQRCIVANVGNVDFFISIHHNAGGGEGAEVLCYGSGIAKEVGKSILNELSKIGLKNRGVKYRKDLFVLKETKMKAILVECAFCDSGKDMSDYDYCKIANAIFNGISSSFEISLGDNNENSSNVLYHTVVSSDTLSTIAKRYGVSVDMLVEINGIRNRNFIVVGQKIIVL